MISAAFYKELDPPRGVSVQSWIQDLREGNVGHVQRRRLSVRKKTVGYHSDTRVIFLTLPETNSFAPENRPGPKRKRDSLSIPTIPFSGAKMLVSGRVDSGNASDAEICTPHNVWFTYTYTCVCLIITPSLAFPIVPSTNWTNIDGPQKPRIWTKKLPKSGFEKVPKGSPRWWFQIFFIFTPIWGRFPIWLIFFRWVETTSQSPFYLQRVFFFKFTQGWHCLNTSDVFCSGWRYHVGMLNAWMNVEEPHVLLGVYSQKPFPHWSLGWVWH